MSLWLGVQKNRGKKKDNYWDKQLCFRLNEILRTEEWRRLSGYFKKSTVQYKNTMEGIYASEKWVIEEYLRFLKESIIDKSVDLYLESESGAKEKYIEDALLSSNRPRLIEVAKIRRDTMTFCLKHCLQGWKIDLWCVAYKTEQRA